jgi:ArsR family transcriptional regulator
MPTEAAVGAALPLPIAQARVVSEPRNRTLEVLRALGHPMRLELVAQIAARGPICTCHLQEALSCDQPTVSKHLAVLRRAGLISGRREGRWVYHSVDAEALDAARDFLEELNTSLHRPHSADRCDEPA